MPGKGMNPSDSGILSRRGPGTRRAWVTSLFVMLACARPTSVSEAGPPDATQALAPRLPPVLKSIQYGGGGKTGGFDLRLPHDGIAHKTYFNRGFSPSGGEVVDMSKPLDGGVQDDVWALATEILRAPPAPSPPVPTEEAGLRTGEGESRSLLLASDQDGGNVQMQWALGTSPTDPRVQRLTKELDRVLAQ
jgi:hypothetical protein